MTTRAKSISIAIYRNSICKYIINLLKNDKFYPNFNIFYRLSIKTLTKKTPQMHFDTCGVNIIFFVVIQFPFRVLLVILQGTLLLLRRRY